MDWGKGSEALGADLVAARAWLAVAVGSLLVAGLFAVVLVVGRLPLLAPLFPDPSFFRRCLVVHVDLALVIWFYAFAAALASLVGGQRPGRASRAGACLAVGAIVLLMTATVVPGGVPILSNYIPVVDSPIFAGGLLLFALATALALFDHRLFAPPDLARRGALAPAAVPFVRAAAVAFAAALATFWVAWTATPRSLPAEVYYERLVWGGGHALQFCSVAAMIAAWLTLAGDPEGGVRILGRPAARLLAGLLAAPVLIAPVLVMSGTETPLYRRGFTLLMEGAIAPVTIVVLAAGLRAFYQGRRRHAQWDNAPALATSALLTLLGFALGFAIDGSNTMVPAHYHASLGGVTAAFMAFAYRLADPQPSGAPLWERRLRRWQVPVFGAGQILFAVGFALAGSHGAARKVYGAEQQIRSAGEQLGLGLMGLGGLIAAAGGIGFLALMVRAGSGRVRAVMTDLPALLTAKGGHAYGK